MRAATLDQRIAGVSFGWEGARNASPSVQRVNGTVIRRNLFPDPRFANAPTLVRGVDLIRDGGMLTIVNNGGDANPAVSWTFNVTPATTYTLLIQAELKTAVPSQVDNDLRVNAGTNGWLGANQRNGVLRISFTSGTGSSISVQVKPRLATGAVITIRQPTLEQGSTVGPYFDGDTAVNAATINGATL